MLNLKFILKLIFFSFVLIHSNLCVSYAEQKVSKILVEGNQRVDDDTILSFITLSEGSSYVDNDVNIILKDLYKTGFFSNVQVSNKDGVFVILVEENSILNLIGFEGNKRFDDEILNEIISLKKNQIYSKKIVSEAITKLIELYKTQGRLAASIVPKVVELDGKRVDLVFEIDEGPLYTVKNISFVGNKIFSDRRLKEIISTKQTAWWRFITSSDNYNPERLEIDASKLRDFYFTRGYINFKILKKQGDLLPDKNGFSDFICFKRR